MIDIIYFKPFWFFHPIFFSV